MPKSKWLETLKSVQPTDGGHAASVYKRHDQNLALDLSDDPTGDEDEDDWSYREEVYGQKPDTIHTFELLMPGGVDVCLRSKFDMSHCYKLRLSLRTPRIRLGTVAHLLKIFPRQMANGLTRDGTIMNILGFDNFFRSIDHGSSIFDIYMHDGPLRLTAYGGNYGGRGNLRPLDSHYPLEVIPTPEWIWTPEQHLETRTEP
jgi:hypothetical protein